MNEHWSKNNDFVEFRPTKEVYGAFGCVSYIDLLNPNRGRIYIPVDSPIQANTLMGELRIDPDKKGIVFLVDPSKVDALEARGLR